MSSGMKTENALHDKKMVMRAIKDAFLKLAPRTQIKNPVMFLVFVSAIMTTVLWDVSLFGIRDAAPGYILGITIILWFTVLFANFAEAIAEGRGKAQAEAALEAARAEAEGLALKEKAMGPNMLRAKAFENMLNNAKVYLPSGKDAEGNMSVLGILNLDKEPAK